MSCTLHEGDCLDILPTLPAASVDAIIADTPYGTTACKWDSVIPFEPMWQQLKRIIKPRGAIVLFGSQPFTGALVMSNPKMFRYEWVWDKVTGGSPMNSDKGPMRTHEVILVFSEGVHAYHPIEVDADPQNIRTVTRKPYEGIHSRSSEVFVSHREKRFPKSIVRFNAFNGEMHRTKRLHPTQKPVPLLDYLIRTYTNEGETVLDFTMGSGTTGVACLNTGRRFIGIEKDAHYFQVAQERIAKASEALHQEVLV